MPLIARNYPLDGEFMLFTAEMGIIARLNSKRHSQNSRNPKGQRL